MCTFIDSIAGSLLATVRGGITELYENKQTVLSLHGSRLRDLLTL